MDHKGVGVFGFFFNRPAFGGEALQIRQRRRRHRALGSVAAARVARERGTKYKL